MEIAHLPCQEAPARGSMKQDVWVYRTEVRNTLEHRIRVIWFEYYFADGEGTWFGVNVRNRPLRNEDFAQ